LIWRRNSPREKEFRMMAGILRDAAETQEIMDTAQAA